MAFRSKVLRSSKGFSVLHNGAIQEFHASRTQSLERGNRPNEHRTISQGPKEAKLTGLSSNVHKEVALPSQEGHTGLVSHVLYVLQPSR